MVLDSGENSLGDIGRGLVAAGGETGPVVKVDDADFALGRNDAVTAVNFDIKSLGSRVADGDEVIEVKLYAARFAVDSLMAILAVPFVKRVEPKEERRAVDTVELDEVPFEMTVDDGTGYASEKIFLKHFLCLLGMTDIGHILLVHGVEIAALDPAAAETGLDHRVFDNLVGIDNEAFGVGDVAADKDAGHALAGAVFDTVARVDDEVAVILLLLKDGDGPLLAAHVENDGFGYFARAELLLAVDLDLAAAFAQLLGGDVEDGGIVADVVGRIGTGSHDAGYFDFSHFLKDER